MEYKLLKNTRASSLSGWTETALFSILFITLFVSLIAFMNVKYSQNHVGDFGLMTIATNTQNNLSGYQDTLQQSVESGTASSSGLGLSLTTTWGIISAGASIMWNFTTGGWIEQVTRLAQLPDPVALILRIIYVLSIGFIILKLILKVKA